MSNTNLVRSSRDGDQFHYRWAARRCLRLLRIASDLKAVTIEGISAAEGGGKPSVQGGEEVVDVGEYYGSQTFEKARLVRYVQLKHSTVRTDKEFTASELERTISEFAKRYTGLKSKHGAKVVQERLQFEIFTNRPFSKGVINSVTDIACGSQFRSPSVAANLIKHSGLTDQEARKFFGLLELKGGRGNLAEQETSLAIELNSLLSAPDMDAYLHLVDLVTKRAGSQGAKDPAITASDVLQALRVGIEDLFPAPSRLDDGQFSIAREEESSIAAELAKARQPVLISAQGGAGKSVLAGRLGSLMPDGSKTVVYDCFGNGEYRRRAQSRHPHRVALVQIANELAAEGLCEITVPVSGANERDFMRTFSARLEYAAKTLRSHSTDALIVLVVDAADNAQMAADEFGEPHAFVRDLVRMQVPEGVRVALLHRPERESLLKPPPRVKRLSLSNFSLAESGGHLRKFHPTATDTNVKEFHRLSSQNPRVQANAIAAQPSLSELLQSLGPVPTSVEDQISEQLSSAVDKIKDEGPATSELIDRLCAALGALRPRVPIEVLAAVSGFTSPEIKSFATDLGGGRPLMVLGDTVQFRDEPVESWFRTTFSGDARQLSTFVSILAPLAETSTYVASCLPSLMLGAGQLSELIELALSDKRLPNDRPLERRQIELERLQFALRASLQAKRWSDAAKLAMKAGQEAAGSSRHDEVLQENPDLIAVLYDPDRIQELIARQIFKSGTWLGRRYCREAALLAPTASLQGDALSKLRMADTFLDAWARLSPKEREGQKISDEDRANLALAQLDLHGPEEACQQLMRWAPDQLWYRCARIVASRLLEHGREKDLRALASTAAEKGAAPILGAIAEVLSEAGGFLEEDQIRMVLSAKIPRSKRLNSFGKPWLASPTMKAMLALVEQAATLDVTDFDSLARKLRKITPESVPSYISTRHDQNRDQLLRLYSLRAALRGEACKLESLASDRIREELKNRRHSESREGREFRVRVGALLPWWNARAQVILAGRQPDQSLAVEMIAQAKASLNSTRFYEDDTSDVQDEIAVVWFDIICRLGGQSSALVEEFETWANELKRGLFASTWLALAKRSARTNSFKDLSFKFVQRAVATHEGAVGEPVDGWIYTHVAAARAIYSLDPAEAGEYLNSAIEIASKLGDEVYPRWGGILSLARRSAVAGQPAPELAYRVSQAGEFCSDYINRHFDWDATISVVSEISPPSAVAIVSRWRDREVGWFDEHLVRLVQVLSQTGRLSPAVASCMVGFKGNLLTGGQLEGVLTKTDDQELRANILRLAFRYGTLSGFGKETWNDLALLAKKFGLDSSEAVRRCKEAKAREVRRLPKQSNPRVRAFRKINYSKRLESRDIRTPAAALALRKEFYGLGFEGLSYWRAVFEKTQAEDAPKFVSGFLALPDIELHDASQFLEAVPQHWRKRRAVKRALKAGTEVLVKRYCWAVRESRFGSSLPLAAAAKLSGCLEADVAQWALEGVAADVEPAGAYDIFELVPVISVLLSPPQARDALDYSLSLIEASYEGRVGDGPWNNLLEPEGNAEQSFAGLVWGALGSLKEEQRWEAIHVVRSLVALNQPKLVSQLVSLAEKGPGPFSSPTLPFYQQDALLSFLIALARSSLEPTPSLSVAVPLLRTLATVENPHVLIRHFAAKALLALEEHDQIVLSSKDQLELQELNVSKLPFAERDAAPKPLSKRKGYSSDDSKYLFNHDVSKHLMEGLARAFQIDLAELEEIAERVIKQDWGMNVNGHWANEPRSSVPSLSYRRMGHSGAVRSYNEYLSFHATMVAAGHLLKTRSVQWVREWGEDEFSSWIGYRLLTRRDGLWLCDRRDATPNLPPIGYEVEKDLWQWSVCRSDFDRVVGLSGTSIPVWGSWSEPTPYGVERFSVRSALVDPRTSSSYLAGAQSADHPWDYLPPSDDSDHNVSRPPYVVRGWVRDGHVDRQMDKHDPWSAGVGYPPPIPAPWITESLKLTSGMDGRHWYQPRRQNPLFVSEVWSEQSSSQRNGPTADGERLLIKRHQIKRVLNTLQKDMVLSVEIRREPETRSDQWAFGEYPLPYFLYYLFGHDGTIRTYC